MIGNRVIKRVLVVGSWAKEQITIENLKKKENIDIFAYLDTRNPAIISLVNGYKIGELHAIDNLVNYAKKEKIDLVIITTAVPLSLGLVDALEKEKIIAFGPTKQAARLETDKAFTRELMKKYRINALPQFQVFAKPDDAIQYARNLRWNVAVKPIGLTEGLGVKVFKDQLKTEEDIINYIHQIFHKKIGGCSKVLIEEKLVGEEFTIQCFVNGTRLIPTPAVQDFKKLLPGEKGLNTAGMGSYSTTGYLLPFMDQEDYHTALEIIRKTLVAFHSETGEECRGFLYGQFMITEDGIKLVEYNFRPGDPEWMNTVSVLKNNIGDVVNGLLRGEEVSLRFDNKATVCKYIVPPSYPEKLHENLDVSLQEEELKKEGVNIYYSCGLTKQGKLNVGSERGIAFIAKSDTITTAQEKVEKAVSLVKGDFHYRKDIGTKELIDSKITYVRKLKNKRPTIRKADEKEFLEVYRFVSKCPPLENYAEHFYKIILQYFSNSCFIAEQNSDMVGVALGFMSQVRNKTYFLWQIGVAPFMQGKGIGKMLLGEVEKEIRKTGGERIELTVDPENISSQKLFEKMGYKNISNQKGETVKVGDKLAIKDYYSPERHFILYEKLID